MSKTLLMIIGIICALISVFAIMWYNNNNKYVGEIPPVPRITNHEVGNWTNIHKGNKDLVGIHIQQFPDCQYEAGRYEGKHPAMIIYVFKNNKAHQVGYEPNGVIRSGFWWNIPEGDRIWNILDIRLDENK